MAWVSRLLTRLGHEAIVANARQVRLISHSTRKDDKLDARMLARLARPHLEQLRRSFCGRCWSRSPGSSIRKPSSSGR